MALVGAEGQAIGALQIVHHHAEGAGLAVDAVHVLTQFGGGGLALPMAADAKHRVGEPNAAVRAAHDVVGRVQAFVLKAIGQHADAPVMLGAGDATPQVLTGQQAALSVAAQAVGKLRGGAKHAGVPTDLIKAQDAVVGNV